MLAYYFILQRYNRGLSGRFPLSLLQHVALVSWGRTLELSTVLTSGVCDWLESVAAAAVTGTIPDDMIASRNYSLLLIRPAEQRNKLLAKQARTNTMVGRLIHRKLNAKYFRLVACSRRMLFRLSPSLLGP